MIRLTARQSMVLVAIVLGGFFVISFAFLGSNSTPTSLPIKNLATETPAQTPQPAIEATIKSLASAANVDVATEPSTSDSTNPSVEIKNFKRSENKNGKLAWELAGSSARYEIGGSHIQIKDAKVTTRLSNGNLATLETPHATILMDGATLNEARGEAGVHITLDSGITVDTESARFERATGKVNTPKSITIRHPQGSLTSDSFSGDTTTSKFVFTGNVQTTILPKEK